MGGGKRRKPLEVLDEVSAKIERMSKQQLPTTGKPLTQQGMEEIWVRTTRYMNLPPSSSQHTCSCT